MLGIHGSTGRRIFLGLIAIGLAALFVRLGGWQLDRRAQRAALERAIEERSAAPPLDWTDPASIPADTAGVPFRRVRVAGVYDRAREIVLRGRSVGGRPGVEVLTPLRTPAGAVLVLRGFLPAPDALRADLGLGWPEGAGDSVPAVVEGTLLRPRTGDGGEPLRVTVDGRSHLALAGPDHARIAEGLPYALLPHLVRADDPGVAAPALLPPREIERGMGPHLAYAVQWFAFAAIVLVGTAALIRKESRS